MMPTHCSTLLTRLPDESADVDGEVVYTSRGSVLVLADGPFDAAPFGQIGLAGPVVLVSDGPDLSDGPTLTRVHGRARRARGWLGNFSVELSDIPEKHLAAVSPGKTGVFDLLIDLSAKPLIDRSVPPIGYFAPRDRAELISALAQCVGLTGRFSKPRYFEYTAGLCAHSSFGQQGCSRCLDVCGAVAIRSAGDRIQVEPNLCQGCAACTLACPTGALSFREPTRASLLRQLEEIIGPAADLEPTLIVHGPNTRLPEQAPDRWLDLMVDPLAAFGEELWFAALAAGARRIVLLADHSLPSETRRLLQSRVDTARSMLEASGRPAHAIELAENPEQVLAEAQTHRSDSLRAEDIGQPAIAVPLPTEHKRALLSRAFARLEMAHGFDAKALNQGSPLGTIIIDQALCTLCSACAKVCPAGAIGYSDTVGAGLAQLAFAEELCVQCGICAASCPENAIVLQPRIAPIAQRGFWRVVSSNPLAECLDCGRGFIPKKLLAVSINRAEELDSSTAAISQMQRCPDCRQSRIRNG